jgi:hypothetical protein
MDERVDPQVPMDPDTRLAAMNDAVQTLWASHRATLGLVARHLHRSVRARASAAPLFLFGRSGLTPPFLGQGPSTSGHQ